MKHSRKAARPFGRMTLKQSAFVMTYVETSNAAEAYRRAYDCASMSPTTIHSESWRMLAMPKIKAAIAQVQASHRKRHEATVDKIMEELGKIGFSNMLDYMTIQDNGDAIVDFSNLTRDKAAAIAEVTIETYTEGKGEGAIPVKRTRFKLSDKQKALIEMGRHLGMFKDAAPGDADAVATPDAPRETGADHLEGLAKRYASGLKVVQGGKKGA